MFIVRTQNTNEIVAICSRWEDAKVYDNTSFLDDVKYTIEDTEETEHYNQMALALEDGIGEGQVR